MALGRSVADDDWRVTVTLHDEAHVRAGAAVTREHEVEELTWHAGSATAS